MLGFLSLILFYSCNNIVGATYLDDSSCIHENDDINKSYYEKLSSATMNCEKSVVFKVSELPEEYRNRFKDDESVEIFIEDSTTRGFIVCRSTTFTCSHDSSCSGVSWGGASTRNSTFGAGNCHTHGAYNAGKWDNVTWDCKNCRAWKEIATKYHW